MFLCLNCALCFVCYFQAPRSWKACKCTTNRYSFSSFSLSPSSAMESSWPPSADCSARRVVSWEKRVTENERKSSRVGHVVAQGHDGDKARQARSSLAVNKTITFAALRRYKNVKRGARKQEICMFAPTRSPLIQRQRQASSSIGNISISTTTTNSSNGKQGKRSCIPYVST